MCQRHGTERSWWSDLANVKFKLNLPGLNELMKSSEMADVLNQAADQIAAKCGEGYEVERAHPISFVGITSVRAGTIEAKMDNRKNNTILKAAGSVKI